MAESGHALAGGAGGRTDLDAEPLEADDEDVGGGHAPHGLAAVDRQLARMQVLVLGEGGGERRRVRGGGGGGPQTFT